MDIHIIPTRLDGPVIVETDFARDERGFFIESYHRRRYAAHGIDVEFVQDNHSRSGAGVLRGIHYQDMRAPTAKLVRCTVGRVWDVVVDLRAASPTFGQWVGVELSAQNMRQLFVPVGFGHAFLTLSAAAEFQYKCSNFYAPETEAVIAWNDPDLRVAWPFDSLDPPLSAPVLSARDQQGMPLARYRQAPAFR
jgi:dTDP-4-dehydrorhamnose 3,5-epimerase